MSREKWQNVQDAIRQQYRAPVTRDKQEFWSDFRARAELGPGPQAETPASSGVLVRRLSWALAACLATALLITALAYRTQTGAGQAYAQRSQIEEVQVFVPCASVMIMQDAESGGSVVWLADLEPEEASEEG